MNNKKIHLKGYGDFYAYAYGETEKETLFVFDECVALKPMNSSGSNKGGFEASELKKWMETELLEAFPDNLRNEIVDISIPSIGEIFGHKDEYVDDSFELDDDQKFPVLHGINHKISWYKGNPVTAWLKNPMKSELSKSFFAATSAGGEIDYRNAAAYLGVRPVFWLKKRRKSEKKKQTRREIRCERRFVKYSPELAEMLTKIEEGIESNGITLKEAAHEINCQMATLYGWFNGKTTISAQSLLKVADIAGYELTLIEKEKED